MTTCATCPRFRVPVPSTGPRPCRVILLGECPSRSEDRDGEPFTGPTGEELTTVYIPLTGLARSDFHIANVRMCSHADYHNPTEADAMACANANLSTLLNEVRPEIIVPMGAIACSIFDGIKLNLHHGIMQRARWGSWQGWVFPTFHPTAGMRTTAYMIPLMADFKRLGEWLRNEDAQALGDYTTGDQYPDVDYQVIRSKNDIEDYWGRASSGFMDRHNPNNRKMDAVVAEDTESLPDNSEYCLTFSLYGGSGRLIYSRDTDLIREYAGIVEDIDPLHVVHNYLHDVVPFKSMGIPINRFADTMVMAYNRCLGGGGDDEDGGAGRGSLSLKVLAYRLLGMSMTSFRDTVYPHSLPHLMKWLRDGNRLLSPTPWQPTCVCGLPQSFHEPRGATMRRTGPCPDSGCAKYKAIPKPKKDEDDKRLDRLHRKINGLIIKLESGRLEIDPYEGDDGAGEGGTEDEGVYSYVFDPWKRMAKQWHPWDREAMAAFPGVMPRASIAHVPEPQLLQYAARDPDATLRLYLYLKQLVPWIYYED
jgi:uracil-DNA glycosylase family 4